MTNTVNTDIAIFGGGIAGLCLLNRLRQAGHGAILFESNALGGEQSMKSQGIIHGGTKYALQGKHTASSQAITDMPNDWKNCLAGTGDLDLTAVRVLSDCQYLWSTASLGSKLATFFASKMLRSKIVALKKSAYPAVLQDEKFSGQVYQLAEIVLDVPSLIQALVTPCQDFIFKIGTDSQIHLDAQQQIDSLTLSNDAGEQVQLKAKHYVFTAGMGNETWLKKFDFSSVSTQRRPLHMVLVKLPFSHALYAHCINTRTTPRLTITTHYTKTGETVWYLGGQLAEEGVKRNKTEQIHAAQQELKNLFPWLNFDAAQWASFHIDRCEPAQAGNKRPDDCVFHHEKNALVAWPTKLAMAPKLAQQIVEELTQQAHPKQTVNLDALQHWPKPNIATPIWDELLC